VTKVALVNNAPVFRRSALSKVRTMIGFSINEGLLLATLLTGACWVAWRLKARRLGAVPARKPWWVHFGAELFVVVALMFTCRVAVADWPRVPTGSMEPTLRVGDYLLVNHLVYGPRLPFTNTAIEFGKPQRGDVVVFRYPLDVSQFYVKRLIGLPGDVVHFEDGKVRVGDAPFEVALLGEGVGAEVAAEDRGQWLLRETLDGDSHTIKLNPFVQGRLPLPGIASQCTIIRPGAWSCRVPEGHYLMLGDNRDSSADSRDFGFLPHGQVYGKAVRVLFNLSDRSRWWKPL
jgi:signal peptidase I